MKDISDIDVISKYEVGSFLYGLNTDKSDHDYSGVYIKPLHCIINPLENIPDEIDLGFTSKLDNGKNDKDAVDFKLYSFDNFIKLVYNNNPNIVEHLNVTNFIYIDDRFKLLIDNKDLFINKNIFSKFIGYALSQEKKMYVKSENITEIDKLYKFMTNHIVCDNPYPIITDSSLVKFIQSNFGVKSKILENNRADGYFKVGDLEFALNKSIKDMFNKLKFRYESATHRADGILDKGYDTKFASHCVRLLVEGIELATTKEIKFPLIERDLLLDIKLGKYSIKEVSEIIDMYKLKYESTEKSVNLYDYNDKTVIKKISQIIVDIYKQSFGLNFNK